MPLLRAGSSSQSVYVEILDSTSTSGGRKTGLVYNTAGLTAYYVRQAGSAVQITLGTLAAANSAWSSGGFKEVDSANLPGVYRLDVPDAAIAAGVPLVVITVKGATGGAQVSLQIDLTAMDLQDSVRAGLTALPNVTAGANGGLPTGNASGQVVISSTATGAITSGSFGAGAIDAAAIATDAIGSAELAASAVTEIQSGLATAASIAALNNLSAAQVNAEADTALADVGLTTTITGRIDAAVSTRSIAGDAMALTSGERTTLAGVIWDRLTSAITAVGSIGKLIKDNLDATVSSRLASSSYTTPPTVGAIADAVWDEDNTTHVATDSTGQNLASAYNAAQGAYNIVFARIPATLVGGRMNASVGAVAAGAITSAGFAAGAIDNAAIATDAIGAAELAADAVAEIRTAILQQALTEGYATDGAAFTVEQALFEIAQILEERSISGTTLTVKKRDGTTTAMVLTLDSATVPTSQTRAS